MREKEPSTRVIFVRHGETDFPVDRIYCDTVEDPALNDTGLSQAADIADFLSDVAFDAALCSSSKRTRMTAEAIASRHPGLNIQHSDMLQERRFGVWEGMYFSDIEAGYPDEYRAWKRDQAGFKPQAGESVFDLSDRVFGVLRLKIDEHRGQTLLFVSHVGPIRVLVCQALGLPLEKYRQLRIDPASATCVDYGVRQNNLIYLNCHDRHSS